MRIDATPLLFAQRLAAMLLVAVVVAYSVVAAADEPTENRMTRAEIEKRLEQIADSIVIEDGQIQSITLKGEQITDEHLQLLAGHGNVKSVSLVDVSVTGKGIATLGQLEMLTGLGLYGLSVPWVTNDVCQPIGRLEKLNYLTIHKGRIDDAALTEFAPLCQLIHLELNGCAELTGEGLRHLTCDATLEWLFLDSSGIQGDALRHLARFTKLKKLWLQGTQIDDASLQPLTDGFERLETLLLINTSIGDDGAAHIATLKRLTYLDVENTQITDEGLSHLGNLEHLSFLDLRGTRVTGAGLRHLTELTKLETLHLNDLPIADEYMLPLLKIKSLKDLYVGTNPISNPQLVKLVIGFPDELMPSLAELHVFRAKFYGDKKLLTTVLDVSDPLFNDSHVKLLKWLYVKCHHVRLANTRITDKGLDELRGMPHIQNLIKLDLSDTQVTDEAIEHFKQQLPRVEIVR